MILVIGKAFINLGARQIGKTIRNQTVDRFAVLEQADNVMHANPRAFHACIAASDSLFFDNVSVGFARRSHAGPYHIPPLSTMSFLALHNARQPFKPLLPCTFCAFALKALEPTSEILWISPGFLPHCARDQSVNQTPA
ncbi:MAG TPA: hypothetical protein VG938_08140 [Verrucomicrobiae bacterium]|nr:hypothetical protein [Verrucomicrobiae bacterium]